jgi:hypothetical protein
MKKPMYFKSNLIALTVFISTILASCDIDEIRKVEELKVRTETRFVLPLAYGSIELETLLNYVSPNDSIFPVDEEGRISFKPSITEAQFPDTFAFKGSLLEALSHLELRIETENNLPLGISLELIFADSISFTEYGDHITCDLLEPAVIDQNGIVTQSTHYVETIILGKKSISEYQKANVIFALVNFFLPKTQNKTISANQKDSLTLNVGVVFQAKTNEN